MIESVGLLLNIDADVEREEEQTISYKFEQLGGLDALEELQKHPDMKVYNQVEEII